MYNFLLIIICCYILLSPIYLLPSGLPQPADVVVAFGAFVFLFSEKIKFVIKIPVVIYLFRLILLITIINFSYWFYFYVIKGIENRMFFVPLFYIFNGIFFLMFIATLYKDGLLRKKFINIIGLMILLTLSIQFYLALIGFQYVRDEETSRATIFFNNPNQLGYFSLLMLTIFTVLPSIFRKNILIIIFIVFITSYLVLYSGSRAALAGVFLLTILLFYVEGFKFKLKSFLLLLITIISLPVLVNSNFFNDKIELMTIRNERHAASDLTEFQIRGYDRLLKYPEYIFFGAGEGRYDRFDSRNQLEMHSGFGTILFSYGILGFILFIFFIYEVIKLRPIFYFLILSPVFIYNLTHQGFRTTLFWILLASIYLFSTNNKSQTKYIKTNG